MLTDIFAYRYATNPMWQEFGETERIILVQVFRIVSEQIYKSYASHEKEISESKTAWTDIHDRLSMELGLKELAPSVTGFWVGSGSQQRWNGYTLTPPMRCQAFFEAKFDGSVSADRFIKERLSLIEIAFRRKEEELAKINAELPREILRAKTMSSSRPGYIPGIREEGLKMQNALINQKFSSAVDELNERFRRAGYSLHYHNGFIQISADEITQKTIEQPFWSVVSAPEWKNVDVDMKEALDLRDNGGRDPAFYAAKALESTIKILSDKNNCTTGNEKGAANYLDRLASHRIISAWERDIMKKFFFDVRNSLGHGPGSAAMPSLDTNQTQWAIEFCMSSIKGLVLRT